MDRDELDQRLSRMSTVWTMVFEAHGEEADAATAAMSGLRSGIRAWSIATSGAVRDPDAAAELSQEFALRILRGAFKHADPSRGRFRDYLKTALIHLVDDYRAAQRSRPRPLPRNEPVSPTPASPGDRGRLPRELARRAAGSYLEGTGGCPADVPRGAFVPRRESRRAFAANG